MWILLTKYNVVHIVWFSCSCHRLVSAINHDSSLSRMISYFNRKFRRGWTVSFLPHSHILVIMYSFILIWYICVTYLCVWWWMDCYKRQGWIRINFSSFPTTAYFFLIFFFLSFFFLFSEIGLSEGGRLICNSTMSKRILEMLKKNFIVWGH